MTQTTDEPKKQRPSHSGIGDRYPQRGKLSQRTGIGDRYPQRKQISQGTGIGGLLHSPIRSWYPRSNNYSFRKSGEVLKFTNSKRRHYIEIAPPFLLSK
jgi:hypothetical protein